MHSYIISILQICEGIQCSIREDFANKSLTLSKVSLEIDTCMRNEMCKILKVSPAQKISENAGHATASNSKCSDI